MTYRLRYDLTDTVFIIPDPMRKPSFHLGRLSITRRAAGILNHDCWHTALGRHMNGDWGDVPVEDRALNDEAVQTYERVVSIYHDCNGKEFRIVTEWDRSTTTIVLPDDY